LDDGSIVDMLIWDSADRGRDAAELVLRLDERLTR